MTVFNRIRKIVGFAGLILLIFISQTQLKAQQLDATFSVEPGTMGNYRLKMVLNAPATFQFSESYSSVQNAFSIIIKNLYNATPSPGGFASASGLSYTTSGGKSGNVANMGTYGLTFGPFIHTTDEVVVFTLPTSATIANGETLTIPAGTAIHATPGTYGAGQVFNAGPYTAIIANSAFDGTAATMIATTSAPSSATVASTVFLEGAFNGTNLNTALNSSIPTTQPYSINGHSGGSAGSIPAGAVDWVLVELREASSAALALNSTKVGSVAGFLMNDGTIKASDGTSDLTVPLTGNAGADFYVVVYHRNHLPIMSANAISESGGSYTIDFTTNSANTYQTTTALVSLAGSKFGMPAGDSNGDGSINTTDLGTWRTNNGAVYSYSGSGLVDFNLDGEINAVDRNDFQQKNTSKTRQVPTT
ncbi:hypothetical protein [Roseivirga sp.]|uniref:hypothetical protein n=1 Tax=Roseivirga sp. TaxID=1964215 RepID=UPI003B8E0FA0